MATAHAHHHNHHDAGSWSESRLKLSLGLTLGFVLLEIGAGLRANSLALVSDAGHNFTDALALALSWYAIRIARRPASATRTFGYHRVGILAALLNAVTLLLVGGFIFREAWELFLHPRSVAGLPMIVVAAIAVFLNTVIAMWLRGEAHHDVNIRSAYIHMVGDALSSAAVIAAGLAIRFTGWVYADPLVSVFIGVFIVASSWSILSETLNILLEGVPRGMDVGAMAQAIRSVPGVAGVHDLHVWAIAGGINSLSCHLDVREEDAPRAAQVVRTVKDLLAARYEVTHSTIETECSGCHSPALYCQLEPTHASCDHDHAHN